MAKKTFAHGWLTVNNCLVLRSSHVKLRNIRVFFPLQIWMCLYGTLVCFKTLDAIDDKPNEYSYAHVNFDVT